MSAARLEIHASAPDGRARTGLLSLPHGEVPTPAFMPVGTLATVKAVLPEQVREAGAAMILANAYHLMLRPGVEIVRRHGGLHRFMGWEGPILTDSGGFQVYSLADSRKIDDDGVDFRSHVDGTAFRLTPERAIEVQEGLGADVMMCFDECPPSDAPRRDLLRAMDRTTRWAERCLEARTREDQALFGIVQGGADPALRVRHARELVAMPFCGFAVGGLSVGEPADVRRRVLEATTPELPADKPRYLMGVGTPRDIVEAVMTGVDLFDCVLPTRTARTATVYTSGGRLNLKNARFREDTAPLDPECPCVACRRYSRAYLSHLVRAKEALKNTLLTIHNLTHYQRLMAEIRDAVPAGGLAELRERELELEGR